MWNKKIRRRRKSFFDLKDICMMMQEVEKKSQIKKLEKHFEKTWLKR